MSPKMKLALGIGAALAGLGLYGARAIVVSLRHDTVYAEGFAEAKFDAVEIGMSEEAVRGLLGDPLLISERSDGRFVKEVRIAPDVSN